MSTREGGRFELRFSAPADVGALVEAALSEARDALFAAGTAQVTWADALVEVCARSLGAVASLSRQDSFRVYVHLDAEGGWLTGRPRLPGHLVAKLTCAGTVQPLWQRAGVPVSVGRALRIVPERTRRLVLDRDRGCRFPGCVARAHLEVHHVVHWADGGRTDLGNLVACARSITTPTTAGSSGSPVMRTRRAGWCSWPVAASRSGRARPTPRPHPGPAGPDRGRRGRGRRGRCARSGCRPRARRAGSRSDELERPHDLGYPDEDADPEPDGQDELWPGVAPPVAYQGATGESAAQQVGHLPRRPSPPALTRVT